MSPSSNPIVSFITTLEHRLESRVRHAADLRLEASRIPHPLPRIRHGAYSLLGEYADCSVSHTAECIASKLFQCFIRPEMHFSCF